MTLSNVRALSFLRFIAPCTDLRAVWDLRAFKKPLSTRSGLGTLYPGTNAIFSPDDKHVVSGAAATSKGGRGALFVMDKNDLAGELVARWEVTATPVKVVWHSKINQVRHSFSPFN